MVTSYPRFPFLSLHSLHSLAEGFFWAYLSVAAGLLTSVASLVPESAKSGSFVATWDANTSLYSLPLCAGAWQNTYVNKRVHCSCNFPAFVISYWHQCPWLRWLALSFFWPPWENGIFFFFRTILTRSACKLIRNMFSNRIPSYYDLLICFSHPCPSLTGLLTFFFIFSAGKMEYFHVMQLFDFKVLEMYQNFVI